MDPSGVQDRGNGKTRITKKNTWGSIEGVKSCEKHGTMLVRSVRTMGKATAGGSGASILPAKRGGLRGTGRESKSRASPRRGREIGRWKYLKKISEK